MDLGPKPVYLINDFDLAKDLLDKAEFSGRTPSKIQLLHRYFHRTPQGIIFTEEEQWSKISAQYYGVQTLSFKLNQLGLVVGSCYL